MLGAGWGGEGAAQRDDLGPSRVPPAPGSQVTSVGKRPTESTGASVPVTVALPTRAASPPA